MTDLILGTVHSAYVEINKAMPSFKELMTKTQKFAIASPTKENMDVHMKAMFVFCNCISFNTMYEGIFGKSEEASQETKSEEASQETKSEEASQETKSEESEVIKQAHMLHNIAIMAFYGLSLLKEQIDLQKQDLEENENRESS